MTPITRIGHGPHWTLTYCNSLPLYVVDDFGRLVEVDREHDYCARLQVF